MARAIVIHGWGGSPKNDWMPWIKKALKEKGYEVFVPEMPNTEHPKIIPWVKKLKETIGEVRSDDILIGHSIGCQTILRYLETLDTKQKVKSVILVAPWQFLILDENEEQTDANPWLNAPNDLGKVKDKAKKFVAIFSSNDPFVPLKENEEYYKENLNPKIIIKKKMGHFTTSDGISELPFLMDLLK